ncbi:MAG: hypothetical protein RLN70_08260, partial [Rhodospirillaceae bacterium]
ESFYLNRYPDVQLAVASGSVASGLEHFQISGGRENRDPNVNFNTDFYLTTNPDVQAAVTSNVFNNGLAHFEAFGAGENRAPTAALVDFFGARYLTDNPDVQSAVTAHTFDSALDHYLQFGAAEGRAAYTGSNLALTGQTSTGAITSVPFFDETYYFSRNPDVLLAVNQGGFTSGLQHYRLFGGKEGRDPGATFDSSYYLASNPDVQAAVNDGTYSSPLEHFNLLG